MGLLILEPPPAAAGLDLLDRPPAFAPDFDLLAGLDAGADASQDGELLLDNPPQCGARGVGKKVNSTETISLSDLGITKDESSRAQQIADQSPELAGWSDCLAEFIWPDFESKPAAVVSFTWPIIFPTRGWQWAASTALEMLPDDLRYMIEDAAARGMTAVCVSAAGEVTEGHHEFWIDQPADVCTWPEDIDDAERHRIYAGDVTDAEKCRDVNRLAWVPTPSVAQRGMTCDT